MVGGMSGGRNGMDGRRRKRGGGMGSFMFM